MTTLNPNPTQLHAAEAYIELGITLLNLGYTLDDLTMFATHSERVWADPSTPVPSTRQPTLAPHNQPA